MVQKDRGFDQPLFVQGGLEIYPADDPDENLRRGLQGRREIRPREPRPGEPGWKWTESVRERKTGRYQDRRFYRRRTR